MRPAIGGTPTPDPSGPSIHRVNGLDAVMVLVRRPRGSPPRPDPGAARRGRAPGAPAMARPLDRPRGARVALPVNTPRTRGTGQPAAGFAAPWPEAGRRRMLPGAGFPLQP